jgi:hypothetical protein
MTTLKATSDVLVRQPSDEEKAALDAKLGPPKGERIPSAKEAARIAKERLEAEQVEQPVNPEPKKPSASKPKAQKQPKKPATKPAKAKAKKPSKPRDTEASDLAKQAKAINEGFGKSSPFGAGEARLLLNTLNVQKVRGVVTITRKSDGATAKFKLAALNTDPMDGDTRKALRDITSEKRVLYPSKLRSFALAVTA